MLYLRLPGLLVVVDVVVVVFVVVIKDGTEVNVCLEVILGKWVTESLLLSMTRGDGTMVVVALVWAVDPNELSVTVKESEWGVGNGVVLLNVLWVKFSIESIEAFSFRFSLVTIPFSVTGDTDVFFSTVLLVVISVRAGSTTTTLAAAAVTDSFVLCGPDWMTWPACFELVLQMELRAPRCLPPFVWWWFEV